MMAWLMKDVLVKRNSDGKPSSGGENERNGAGAVATAARAEGGEDGYG
jgi:hypothetical protein